MPNPIESLKGVRTKLFPHSKMNPDGLAFGAAVSTISPVFLSWSGTSLTFALYELAKDSNPLFLQALAVGGLGALNAASVITEAKALKSYEYSANPASTALYGLTRRPLISSLGGHAYTYTKVSIFNPINVAAMASHNHELIVANEVAASAVLTGWFTSLNSLVLQGRAKPFTEKVGQVRQAVVNRFRGGQVSGEVGVELDKPAA